MQYIRKQNTPPEDWNVWFTKASGNRSFDYQADNGSLVNLPIAKHFLIEEQHGLCAYCQQFITDANSSIEHVIPKEFNKELSTNYYNLVAVCKAQIKDSFTGKFHCDTEKGSKIITPLIFVSNSDVNGNIANNHYFSASSDGTISSKLTLPDEIRIQVDTFIKVLNLNHEILKNKRAKDILGALTQVYTSLPLFQRGTYWKVQYERVLNNPKQPFRQFLLVYIGNRLGIN